MNCIFMCYLTEEEAFKIKDALIPQLDAFLANDMANQINIGNIKQIVSFLQILTLIQQKYNDLPVRQKLAGVFAGLFQHFYNEQFEIQQTARKNKRGKATAAKEELDLYGELLLTTVFGVCVVLTNPGTKDYNLENIAEWTSQLIEQCDWTEGGSFLGAGWGGSETLAIMYHQVIGDLLHLLQSFRYETEELAGRYLGALLRLLGALSAQEEGGYGRFRSAALGLLQKLLNVEGTRRLFTTHGLRLGLLAAEFANGDQLLLGQLVRGVILPCHGHNDGLVQQLLIGLAAGCGLFKFASGRCPVAARLEEALVQLLCGGAEGGEEAAGAPDGAAAAAAEFLAFFAVNGAQCRTKKLQEAVDRFCRDTVNRLQLGALGAYLVQKCHFEPDHIFHTELDKKRIAFYNGLVKQVVSDIEGL